MRTLISRSTLSLLTILFADLASSATNPLSIPSTSAKSVVNGQRSVFMNGVDISSSRGEDLRNVHLRIDEHGNIFITAPHYQVTESETFTPLSSYHHQEAGIERQPLAERKSNSLNQASVVAPATQEADSPIAQPVPVKAATDNGVKTVLPEKPASTGLPK